MICQFRRVKQIFPSTTWQTLLQSCSKLNAHCYFSGVATIIELCNQKHFKEALSVFHTMESNSFDRKTYVQLFVTCANRKSLHNGRFIHQHLSSSKILIDVILHNHILIMYGKCGSMDDARRLFDTMPEKNIVSWTSMISGYSQNNRDIEAVVLYLGMLYAGFLPDQFSLGSMIRSCSSLLDAELGMQLHCHVIKLGYESDITVMNALITMYSKTDRISDAFLVFQRISEKDLISWGSIISGLAQHGHELKALYLFREMISTGDYQPNEFHFGSVLSACGSTRMLRYGEQIHSLCAKLGLEKYVCVGCSLSEMYARSGNLDCTRKAFYQVEAPDLVSWNSVIGAFAFAASVDETMHIFSEMRLSGSKPDDVTVLCLLCACTSSQSLLQGQLIHAYSFKLSFGKDIVVRNAILNMYAKCSDLNTALNLFEEMSDARNTISWNTVLTACLQHQQPHEVFRLSALMRNSKIEFDQVTLNNILSASAELACLKMGYQVHCNAFKIGFDESLMVRNGLINMYTKCGNLNHARNLFESPGSTCDVYTWNSLIVGYAQFGDGRESLELFNKMRYFGNVTPNHVTFVGVLSACSHIGLVEEGLYYYNMLSTTYNVGVTREICSCIVDLLSRAGRLTQAENFIKNTPIEPDATMWKTLLAACRVQNNMDIGKRAAESVLCLDPYSSGAYVLLCNIYASSGCWEDLAMVRKMMKKYGVKKSPGRSWIEVKGEISVFISEDRAHQEMEGIYCMLDVLGFDMREKEELSLFIWS